MAVGMTEGNGGVDDVTRILADQAYRAVLMKHGTRSEEAADRVPMVWSGGEPVDSVARFHLRNGARLERITRLGDPSEKGLSRAGGLMVDYRYGLKDIELNHEVYANHGEIAASSGVSKLLKQLHQ